MGTATNTTCLYMVVVTESVKTIILRDHYLVLSWHEDGTSLQTLFVK